jgi:hypothetical protein
MTTLEQPHIETQLPPVDALQDFRSTLDVINGDYMAGLRADVLLQTFGPNQDLVAGAIADDPEKAANLTSLFAPEGQRELFVDVNRDDPEKPTKVVRADLHGVQQRIIANAYRLPAAERAQIEDALKVRSAADTVAVETAMDRVKLADLPKAQRALTALGRAGLKEA